MRILHKANTLNVYRGTVTGLRISAVDGGATASGGAFVDGLDAGILALPLDGTHSMEIYDSAGRMIRGVLKAVGAGEGLDVELITGDDSDIDTVGNWVAVGVNSEVTSQAGGNPGNALRIKNVGVDGVIEGDLSWGTTLIKDALYKLRLDVITNKAYALQYNNVGSDNAQTIINAGGWGTGSWSTFSYYNTATKTDSTVLQVKWYDSAGNSALLDNFLLEKVLTPSSSGATIVSAKAGVTYNWGYKNASFDYNATSYYCIVKKLR